MDSRLYKYTGVTFEQTDTGFVGVPSPPPRRVPTPPPIIRPSPPDLPPPSPPPGPPIPYPFPPVNYPKPVSYTIKIVGFAYRVFVLYDDKSTEYIGEFSTYAAALEAAEAAMNVGLVM